MNSYDFYKSKLDRELNRRNYLDTAINNPIAGITIVVGIVSYILSENNFFDWESIDVIILSIVVLSSISIVISLFYIFSSYNNLIKGHDYLNYGFLEDYRKVERYYLNLNSEEHKDKFENDIIEKIIRYSDNHTLINDTRAKRLYRAKNFIIIGFTLSLINLIILTFNKFIIC